MFGQFISQGGAKVGSTFPLLSTPDYNNNGYGSQTVEALATDGTNFLVGWQDDNSGNFFGQLVTPSGTLSGQEFLISSGQSGNANTGGGDSIAMAFGRTNYLAVWQSQNGGLDSQTYGALISRNGVVGSPFQINQTASVDGYNPINVAFDGTNYLAAWNWDAGSVSGASEDWEIFGRFVSPTGNLPGNELQLVTDPGSQILPELAFDGANYLMAWGAGSFNAQAANPTVHFQFFNRSGSPAGSEFTVFNAQGTNSPLFAGLVFDGTRFVAVATLGTISTSAAGSVDGFPSAEVFGAFISASTMSPTVTAGNRVGTQFTIQLSGTPGINYMIQFSTNLALGNWTAIATNSPTNGTFSFTDSSATNKTRFYRAVKQLVPTSAPTGMAFIPAGSFTIGDTLDGEPDAIPTNVYVSAFYMDTNLVSLSQWQGFYSYATNHGYSFANAGTDKAANYPVETVDWFDCVKWCNARSQQAGLTPVYYTDAVFTQVFINGDSGTTVYANWEANGYRLPTEAEWEKAARGGLSGQRFPWGDTISESQANYYAYPIPPNPGGLTYDLGPYTGYNINFETGAYPYTSPVGYFAANGYGLYDMAGNVFEWCWDWYAGPTYPTGSPYLGGTDPRGPVGPLSDRGLRGGAWSYVADVARCATRYYVYPNVADVNTINDYGVIGFRCVRGH